MIDLEDLKIEEELLKLNLSISDFTTIHGLIYYSEGFVITPAMTKDLDCGRYLYDI